MIRGRVLFALPPPRSPPEGGPGRRSQGAGRSRDSDAPKSVPDIERFLREMPYLTARMHGAKYRFMYQVYASPKFREHGIEFFKGVNQRYRKYAEMLSGKLGMPVDYIQGMTYTLVRACVHYALFEDEEYLNLQLNAIRVSLRAYLGAQGGMKIE